MAQPLVLSTAHDAVTTITLNRPEVLNAFNAEMIEELIAHLETAERDPEVRAVILTGAGRGFCAGGVMNLVAGSGPRDPDTTAAIVRHLGRASELLHRMGTPTIAAVNGPCAGAGLSLACATDLRYAGRSAMFTSAFARVGQSGDYGGMWFVSRLIGSARAQELYLLSDRVDADQALRYGLVSAVVTDDELMGTAAIAARKLAAMAPLTLAAIKANLHDAAVLDLGEYLDAEAARFGRNSVTHDAHEAAVAFVERREPRFELR
jgi:2-(1,2-epoxy-1,2-dihydrophenyl)acetyl-CoA isomerase